MTKADLLTLTFCPPQVSKLAHKYDCRRIELDRAFHREAAHKFYAELGFETGA